MGVPVLGVAVAAVAVAFALLYWYFTATFDYWRRKGVPFLPPEPFFGNMREMTLLRISQAELLQALYHRLEGVPFAGVFQSRRPALLLRSPALVKAFLVKDFAHFAHRDMKLDERRDPLTANLFTLGGPRWRALRARLTPTFTSGKMKMMFVLMEECAANLVQSLGEPAARAEQVEMKETLAQYATDVIGSCAFGLQINSLGDPDCEFRRMGKKMFEPTLASALRRFTLIFLPTLAKVLNVSLIGGDVTRFFRAAVRETVALRERHGVLRHDFLHLLLQLRAQGAHDAFELTDNLLAAQVFVFFMAGFETTSTTMSFALHELAVNPDVQARLQEEVDAALQETDGRVTYDAVMKMEYLDKVIQETLRKYPPVSTLARGCTAPYRIPGTDVTLEKGTRVLVPVFALHRDPAYYPEPERFDPERFSPEQKAQRPPFTYLPFGEGPRICIGMRFGLLQVKTGLAALLARYSFEACERTQEPPRLDPKALVTAAEGGAWLRVRARCPSAAP
ncbi:hypothetical protein R5R35_002118 [Gryllus longicercus]|uniref:Cytochrome P450 n=1 Tax=Gryllus longicercus TaxID=2509291 RepID=A0AAN9VPQ6_9ORTH